MQLQFNLGSVMEIVLKAIMPSGAEVSVYDDGTTDGFPEGTVFVHGWHRLLCHERGLRIKALQQELIANQEAANILP